MSTTTTTTASTSPKWLSTNFALNVILFIGGAFIGFSQGDAATGVGAIATLIGAVGAIREKIKGVDIKGWLSSSNTWAYLGTLVVTFVPTLPVETFQHLGELARNVIGGNWQGILVSLFSIGTILYQLFKQKPAPVA